ncbi:MAG: alanine racemase [Gammaproteobacteria bacterium]|nr:MAG: alanine racemase [Gammaproteobacteria bacterium]
MSFGARALIRLGALRHNLEVIRNTVADAPVMAVVKANAYGHGLLPVANALTGADCFGVARLNEALALRQGGIRQPVVLLSGVRTGAELQHAIDARLDLVVHCQEQVDLLQAAPAGELVVWLKIDTGMHRLGFAAGEAAAVIGRLRQCPAAGELRLMTHLASADEPQSSVTELQFQRFAALAESFDGDISIGNSPGVFGWPAAIGALLSSHRGGRCWIRCGIALYGVSPFPQGTGADLGLRPVMQFESHLIAVKALAKGDRVGYGARRRAARDTTLGLVAAGYGDGYSRFMPAGTPLQVNGRRVPLAGVVSMDLLAVDLGPDATDVVGDPVLLWGDALPVEEIARYAGTIPYQLVSGVMHREPAETTP